MENSVVASTTALFMPFDPDEAGGSPATKYPKIKNTRLNDSILASTATGWSGFQECCVCPDDWNIDFAAAYFSPLRCMGEYIITALTLNVTMQGGTPYPVRATGYVFDERDKFIGTLDLRYFGNGMARGLTFDIVRYGLQASSRLLIAFQIGGGGAPKVPRPPLITSVAIDVAISRRQI
jgi:hypothetical protein